MTLLFLLRRMKPLVGSTKEKAMYFEKGDKVIDPHYGIGTVVAVSQYPESEYPVTVQFDSLDEADAMPVFEQYTHSGRYHVKAVHRSLFHADSYEPGKDKEPERKKEESKFHAGQAVLVRDYTTNQCWKFDYFSHLAFSESEGKNIYVTIGGNWLYCIPFEGNEDKVGKCCE